VFTSIDEDGQDQLANFVEDLKREAKEEEQRANRSEDEMYDIDKCDDILARLGSGQASREEKEEPEKKPRRSKYQAPEYIIVFDDLSSELKSGSLLSLLKFNRHFKSKLIISSQWLHDLLLPESRKQIDLFLIFKGFPDDKVALIYKDCDSGVPFDTFLRIYKKATKKPHSFMYVDTRSDQFRCNFDKQF